MRRSRSVKQAHPLDDTSWPGARVRWMLIGMVPGLAIAAALHLYNQQQQEQLSATIAELRETLEERTEPAAPTEPDLPTPPRFVFHEILTSRDATGWDSFPELPEEPADALTRMQPGEPPLRADTRPGDAQEPVEDAIDAPPLAIPEPVPDAPPPDTDRQTAIPSEPEPAPEPEPEPAPEPAPEPEPEPAPEPEPEQAPEPEPEPTPEPPPATETEQRFVLQVGSFRERSDADRLRARLALLGIEASVQSASANGGVYRVRVGPVDGRQAAERLQERLGNAGFDSILIRR